MTPGSYQARLQHILARDAALDMETAARVFPSLENAMHWAKRATPHALQGWLLFLAAQTLRTTNQLLEEIRTMATNDDQLTTAVQDLLAAYTDNVTALDNEIAAIKLKGVDGLDPAITTAVANIENLAAKMRQSTTDAQAALAAAGSSATGTGAASGSTGVPSAASSGTDPGAGGTPGSSISSSATGTGAAAASSSSTPGNLPSAGSGSTGSGTAAPAS